MERECASNRPDAGLSILTGPEPQEIVVALNEPGIEEGGLVCTVSTLEGG